ncbi:MAG: methyltransferase domain-containing protein, partial [Candidatus Taylorbacteria bacterium]|nr:methyltransferase domain-containing protein [Candidatus Taylorbacteria bacterium]
MKQNIVYQKFRFFLLGILYVIPSTKQYAYKRLPRHKSGYKHFWIEDKGYIDVLEDKQKQVLAHNKYPSPDQLFNAIQKYSPHRVLDIGCGYGRQLEVLESFHPSFKIQGCDITQKWVDVAKQRGFDVFQLDVVMPTSHFLTEHKEGWDVSFCRAVMTFFV